MKILIVGYGRMGQMIHENAHIIGATDIDIIDPNIPAYNTDINDIAENSYDVAIEFTHPGVVYENVRKLLSKKIPVVTGTTGWFHLIDELRDAFDPAIHTLIWGANFSVGMNLFYQIVKSASELILHTKLYEPYGLEKHHAKKVDAPSGTAKVISEIVASNHPEQQTIEFSAVRAGAITGYHELGFDSDFDEIILTHNAKGRKGFAIGALLTARYATTVCGFYDIRDVFYKTINMT
jgi:4-hydroxy-tetrahydrodipicolinate reductase